MRLGHSALMRKALEKEQQLQNEMIQSLMPQEVAREVMQGSYDSTEGEEEDETATGGAIAKSDDAVDGGEVLMRGLVKNKRRDGKKKGKQKRSKRWESSSLSDESDYYSGDEMDPLKSMERSSSCKLKPLIY